LRDLEIGDGGYSRSSKMAPFNRSYMTYHWSQWSAIVSRVYLVIFLSYVDMMVIFIAAQHKQELCGCLPCIRHSISRIACNTVF